MLWQSCLSFAFLLIRRKLYWVQSYWMSYGKCIWSVLRSCSRSTWSVITIGNYVVIIWSVFFSFCLHRPVLSHCILTPRGIRKPCHSVSWIWWKGCMISLSGNESVRPYSRDLSRNRIVGKLSPHHTSLMLNRIAMGVSRFSIVTHITCRCPVVGHSFTMLHYVGY